MLNLKLFIIYVCLFTISITFGQWHTYTNTNFINDITHFQDKLYCATKGGLTIFDKDTQAFVQVITNTGGLPQNQCQCLAQDRTNNIWIGTDGAGLVIFEPQNQIFHSYRSSEISPRIKCILICSDTILVGSENGFYVIDTRGTFLSPEDDQIIRYTKSSHPELVSENILSFAVTDRFWIGSKLGLNSLNRNLDTIKPYPHPFGDSVQAMTVISDSLFIATEAGIAKFDGSGFDTILSLSTPVQDLAYHWNNFFLATDKGLLRYNRQVIDTIWKEPTQKILIDSLIFCGMAWAGLRMLSDTLDTLWNEFYLYGLISNNILSLITNNIGDIYVCHGGQGLSRLSSNSNWTHLYSPLYSARILTKDSKNHIWLGHFSYTGGLSFYDPEVDTWGIIQFGLSTKRNIINALGIDRNNTKWIWNGFGVIVAVDTNSNEIEFNLGIASPPGREGSYEFAFDSKNRVWLGTIQGLLMLDYNQTLFNTSDDRWETFTQFQGNEIVSIAIDYKDRVWIGTASGGGVLNNGEFTSINPPLSNDIKKVRVDTWGIVWFLTARGLSRYDPHTRKWTNYTQSNSQLIPNPDPLNITSFYTALHIDDQNGFLLVGTQAGLSRFDLQDAIQPSISAIRVFPNPCIKEIHEAVTFDSLPLNSKIYIYSLSGKLLTELYVNQYNHQAFFDIKDCSSGIYLAVIISPLGTKVEKFTVIQ